MNGLGKLLLAAACVVVAASVLLVLYLGARHRALVAHCRNNLRHLGGAAVRNWQLLDAARTGRAFWQAVREAQFKTSRGVWLPPYDDQARLGGENSRDPFLCPVHGRTASRPEDAAAIDYLGPRSFREQAKDTPKAEPIGSDRAGNHPSGGHVLRLDTSVDGIPPVIEALQGSDPAWTESTRSLKE